MTLYSVKILSLPLFRGLAILLNTKPNGPLAIDPSFLKRIKKKPQNLSFEAKIMVAGPGLALYSHPFGLRVAYGWTNRGPTDYDHHEQPQKCPSLQGMAPSF